MSEPSQSFDKRKAFAWRAMTSVLIGVSFIVLVVTGFVLFVTPPGRISNWSNWTLLGLRKHEWIALHVGFSTLFLLATVFHLVFNWRPMMDYFKNRMTRRVGFRWEWLVALAICLGVFVGTRADIFPFSSLMTLRRQAKQSWDEPSQGSSTQNPGESSEVGPGHGKGQGRNQNGGGPGGGYGRKTLEQFCSEENIAVKDALVRLEAKGIKASANQTIRDIAANNGFERAYDIIDSIRGK
jgi:hypothetical protein